MKATLSGVGFYKDVQAQPAIVDGLVEYLAGLKGGAAGEQPQDAKEAAASVLVMPNFNFNDDELRNVVTFLLGLQEHTVKWPQVSFAKKEVGASQPAAGMAFAGKSGEEVAKLAGCASCHKFDGPERMVGPSLWDLGTKRDKAHIRESILEPDKDMVPGYPPGLMKATLTGTNFYQNISVDGLEKLVDYLATLKGKS